MLFNMGIIRIGLCSIKFYDYFIIQNEQADKRAIDRIKNSLMDSKIENPTSSNIKIYENYLLLIWRARQDSNLRPID